MDNSIKFDTPEFTQVVEKALALCTGSPRWEKATEQAARGLSEGTVIVTELAGGALVTRNGTYKVNDGCECLSYAHGRKPCVHRAAFRLYQLYAEALLNAQVEARVIERTIEFDRSGTSYTVTRCDGWAI